MQIRHFKIYFLSVICVGLAACEPHHISPSNSMEPKVGIIGGSEVTDSDAVAHLTVGLYDKKTRSRCSGSLISDDIVLTAAHCVDPSSQELFVVFSKNFSAGGKLDEAHLVKALSFRRHENYDPSRSEGTDTFDLALVRFGGGLPANYETVSLNSQFDSVSQPHADLIAAGYGLSNGLFGTGAGVLRKAQLQFRQMHSRTEFETVQGSTGVCSGDSGGPLFQEFSGQLVQVGVASRVATKFLGCRGYAVYTRVDLYENWIREASQKLESQ